MTCGLAEEETRLVSSRAAGRSSPAAGSVFVMVVVVDFCSALIKAPDQVPPADRLRAVLSVGTNRASFAGGTRHTRVDEP